MKRFHWQLFALSLSFTLNSDLTRGSGTVIAHIVIFEAQHCCKSTLLTEILTYTSVVI